MPSAAEITRKANSNLAFALSCLTGGRKRDMVTFYAFCRTIDDLADAPDVPVEKRQKGLAEWRRGIENGFDHPDELQTGVMELLPRHSIPKQPFLDLIDGCASDLQPQKFGTWEDLKNYTYRVASCVGVISTRIFGCTHPDSENYAVALGHALQLTNILRDVAGDISNGGRIYLPLDDFRRFNYSENDLVKHTHNACFIAMMTHHADRAEFLYQKTLGYLRPEDTKALKAAEAMRKIYRALLTKMRADDFKVFTRHYSLSKARKTAILLSTLISR